MPLPKPFDRDAEGTGDLNDVSKPAAPVRAGLVWTFALACGLIVANLYYAQPLVGLIGADLGLSHATVSLVVTLTQLGYGLGLLLLVPLGDRFENRRLSVGLLTLVALSLIAVATARGPALFLLATFGMGLCCVAAQILVPFAASLAPPAERGRVVGNVMSGLLVGILLARPLSSFVAEFGGWRAIYAISAVAIAVLAVALRRLLPLRQPAPSDLSYGALIRSLWHLFRDTPLLRRRATYHAAMFGAFSAFWTMIALRLGDAPFDFSQRDIALFALAGASGALSAPLAGRLADRGLTRLATGGAFLLAGLSFVLAGWGGAVGSLWLLLAAAVILDFAVSVNLVLGQRAIYMLGDEVRGRLNALYMALFFGGGAAGSALAGLAYASGGWTRVCEAAFVALALTTLYFLTELAHGGKR